VKNGLVFSAPLRLCLAALFFLTFLVYYLNV
jgi:hypothetical protein